MPDGSKPPEYVLIDGKRVNVRAQLDELDRVDCEESLAFFLKKAWKYVDPAPFIDGWVIDALCEHLEAVCDGELRRLLINIPPRCLKSTLCSVIFQPWVWAQSYISPTSGPGVSFLYASYAHALTLRDSVKRRRLIKSPWYQRLYGDRFQITPDQDMKIRFQNDKRGESLITSVDAGVTGEGGHIIVVDDPNNAREVLSDAVIQSTNEEWWDGAMSTRLNDPKTGAIVVIQQRLGERDLSGHILDNDKRDEWEHLVLPMHFERARRSVTSIGWEDPRTKEGELLWPQRFGLREVQDLETRLGAWKAAGQLEQRPEPKGGGIIKRDWWRLWPPQGEEFDARGKPMKPLEFPPMSYILASLDTAYTEKTYNDPSALTVWGVFSQADDLNIPTRRIKRDSNLISVYGSEAEVAELTRPKTIPKVMLLYAWSDHLELHPLVTKVEKVCSQFQVDKLLVENKASGKSVAQEIRRLFADAKFSTQLMDTGAVDKMARLYSVQHLFEEGLVFAPQRTWSEAVIAQTGTFPNAQHDDLCFVGETLIKMADGSDRRIDQIVVGDEVLTSDGPAIVSAAACTGVHEIWRVCFDGGVLEGTANHPLWTQDGWKMLATLCPSDILSSWHSREKTASSSRSFGSTATPIGDIQNRRIPRIAATSLAPVIDFIATCGNTIRDLFRKVGRSITKMATPPITPSTIWNAYPSPSIGPSIIKVMWNEDDQPNSWRILRKHRKRQKRGTAALKGESGIDRMLSDPFMQSERQSPFPKRLSANSSVNGADAELPQSMVARSFAGQIVPGRQASGVAVKGVQRTHISRPVFNLTVDGAHCYYANGVLVHNCDTVSMALRYLRTLGLLARPPELQAAIEGSIRHISKARRPLYPGSRA